MKSLIAALGTAVVLAAPVLAVEGPTPPTAPPNPTCAPGEGNLPLPPGTEVPAPPSDGALPPGAFPPPPDGFVLPPPPDGVLPPASISAVTPPGTNPSCTGPGATMPKPFPALFKRTFKAEGDVTTVTRTLITLEDADLNAAKRFEAFLPDGALAIKVTAKTKIRNADGDRIAVGDIEEGDSLIVKGKMVAAAKWVDGEEGAADTPVINATRITVDD